MHRSLKQPRPGVLRRPIRIPLRAALWMLAAAPVLAQPPGGGAPPVTRVETGHVESVETSDALEVTGTIEAWREVEISSRAGGRIVLMPVAEGDHVRKGAQLFELDARAERIALARARAELEKAEAEFQKMTAGFQPEEVEAARKTVAAAEARLKAARDEWERLQPLAEQNVISESERSRALADLEVGESLVLEARARMNLMEEGYRSEEVAIAEAEVRVRKANVDDIERQISDHSPAAEEDGVIVELMREQGEWTSEGQPVLSMVVLDPVKLRIEVPQSKISLVRPGQKAVIRVDGLEGETFEAEVTHVIPRAGLGSRNFPVILQIANKDEKLSAGMFARARLSIGTRRTALAIPREAVQYRGSRMVAYCVDPLPAGFKWSPPSPPPGGGPGRGGPSMKPAEPEAAAREVEFVIIGETESGVLIRPVQGGVLADGDEVVVFGGSRLRPGSLLSRLNFTMPGAG